MYLFAISIGPVQGFIEAARRTRDFWAGSAILSECAKAIARWVAQPTDASPDPHGRLIFPAPVHPADLEPWQFDENNRAPSQSFNASNVVLFQYDTSDPAQVVKDAHDQLIKQWKLFVSQVVTTEIAVGNGRTMTVGDDLDSEAWKIQESRPDDVFEFFAAWIPLADRTYSQARREVMRLLQGRKAVRNFQPWPGIAGRPKSSLDAARETVLKEPEDRVLPLRVKSGEQLDIVGLVKRLLFGVDSIRYPSVSRFAADPWIRGVLKTSRGRSLLSTIQKHCEQLVEVKALQRRRGFPSSLKEDDPEKFSWWDEFPFEGSPLYANRHAEILRDHPYFVDSSDSRSNRRAAARWEDFSPKIKSELVAIQRAINDGKDAWGEPSPYLALIAADGDRMGETLSRLADENDPGLHRTFSEAQTRFADLARRQINSPTVATAAGSGDSFHGAVVYAGADDVLAFSPLDQCLEIARVLQELFSKTLRDGLATHPKGQKAMERLDRLGAFPTLSVGIAIGHFLEPLEDLLGYVRASEKNAKSPFCDEKDREQVARNGLAISLHSRGGAPCSVRDNWRPVDTKAGAGKASLDQRLLAWAELFRQKQLPTKCAYDLLQLSRSYPNAWIDRKAQAAGWRAKRPAAVKNPNAWNDREAQAAALRHDALRVLTRKRTRNGGDLGAARPGMTSQPKETLQDMISRIRTSEDLQSIASEMIIGMWIGDAKAQAAGPAAADGVIHSAQREE